MPLRYLYGPVSPAFASESLPQACGRGECFPFTPEHLRSSRSWEDLLRNAGAPPPDFVVLALPYLQLPQWLWSPPVPAAGFAGDAPLQWHSYRRLLPCLDLVLADAPAVSRMRRGGLEHAWPALMYGAELPFLHPTQDGPPRDIDVLFVGNLHPAVQRERLSWLGRLARLADRWNVVIATSATERVSAQRRPLAADRECRRS